jgi:signal transduction histidine kinase/CheY-like chemotaxis protein
MGFDHSRPAAKAAGHRGPTASSFKEQPGSAAAFAGVAMTPWNNVLRTLKRPSLSALDVLIALAAVALASLVRLALDPLLGDRAPHAVYLVTIVYVAWSRGLWPALLAVLLSALLANYLFMTPRYSLINRGLDNELVEVLNVLVGIVVALFSEALRATAQENARLFQLAEEAKIQKDEFLAMVSHELRNPLAPIRNALYVLSRLECHEPQIVEMHGLIERQVTHLIRLVDDLLDVSRITLDAIQIQKEPVALATLVEGAVEITRPVVTAKQHTLSIELPSSPIGLYGDPIRLMQVFANLLGNAAKYTNYGGHIWLSAERSNGEVIVRVRDNGIGIAPEALGRIFGLFEQAGEASYGAGGGLGIGLAIVRKLVESHAGTVEAQSPGVGLGSEFVVRLPIDTASEQVARSSRSKNTQRQSAPAAGRRILVVDDEMSTANSLATILKLWNHEVRIAYDGFSALEIARTFKPEVVLTDLGLPRMSGYELAKQLRRAAGSQSMLLIAITGYAQQADFAAAQEAGFDERLVKPLDPSELEDLLRSEAD